MFGLGKVDGLTRREWNSRVADLLERKIGIETDSSKNPNFPGILVFGRLLDEGWYQKCCPEDNALYIALAYWEGCAKAGGTAQVEARRIDKPITDFMMEVGMSGKVAEARGRQFVMFYDKHHWKLGSEDSATAEHEAHVPERAILKCPACSQSVRVPAEKNLQIKCPTCAHLWIAGPTAGRSRAEDKDEKAELILERLTTLLIVHEAYHRDVGRDLNDYFKFVGLTKVEQDDLIDEITAAVGTDLRSSNPVVRESAYQATLSIIMKPMDAMLRGAKPPREDQSKCPPSSGKKGWNVVKRQS